LSREPKVLAFFALLLADARYWAYNSTGAAIDAKVGVYHIRGTFGNCCRWALRHAASAAYALIGDKMWHLKNLLDYSSTIDSNESEPYLQLKAVYLYVDMPLGTR
jgi:hypothetical protein